MLGEGRVGQTLAKTFASAEPGAYVVDVVTNGVEGTLMPAWGAEQGGPLSEQEIQEIMEHLAERQIPVTIQSGRTGISGGAVPRGGHILNLGRMNKFVGLRREAKADRYLLRLQPGLLLSQINEAVAVKEFESGGWDEQALEALNAFRESGPFFFPPDPTETSAAIGGMTASDASGARSFSYGPTRRFVESMRMVLIDDPVTTDNVAQVLPDFAIDQ